MQLSFAAEFFRHLHASRALEEDARCIKRAKTALQGSVWGGFRGREDGRRKGANVWWRESQFGLC